MHVRLNGRLCLTSGASWYKCSLIFCKYKTRAQCLCARPRFFVRAHLYEETLDSGRSHTVQSGRWLCRRKGKGTRSRGRRGNVECCATARNLESGQRAVTLQDTHRDTKAAMITHRYMETSTQIPITAVSRQLIRVECAAKSYQAHGLCPFPPPATPYCRQGKPKTLLICSFCKAWPSVWKCICHLPVTDSETCCDLHYCMAVAYY